VFFFLRSKHKSHAKFVYGRINRFTSHWSVTMRNADSLPREAHPSSKQTLNSVSKTKERDREGGSQKGMELNLSSNCIGRAIKLNHLVASYSIVNNRQANPQKKEKTKTKQRHQLYSVCFLSFTPFSADGSLNRWCKAGNVNRSTAFLLLHI